MDNDQNSALIGVPECLMNKEINIKLSQTKQKTGIHRGGSIPFSWLTPAQLYLLHMVPI